MSIFNGQPDPDDARDTAIVDDLIRWAEDRAKSRATDPSTSHQAAKSVPVTKLEQIVLDSLRIHGPMTTHELAQKEGISLVTVSPRIRPLVKKGLVRATGRTRKGDSGRQSIVWEVAV